jgi:hypothetical protein
MNSSSPAHGGPGQSSRNCAAEVTAALDRGERLAAMSDQGEPIMLTHVPGGYDPQRQGCYLLRVGLGQDRIEVFATSADAARAFITSFPESVVQAALDGPRL